MTAARSAAIGIDFGTTNTVVSMLDATGHAHLASFPTTHEPIVAFRSALSFHAPPEDPSGRVVEAGPGTAWLLWSGREQEVDGRRSSEDGLQAFANPSVRLRVIR